jgi:hypothetical protein
VDAIRRLGTPRIAALLVAVGLLAAPAPAHAIGCAEWQRLAPHQKPAKIDDLIHDAISGQGGRQYSVNRGALERCLYGQAVEQLATVLTALLLLSVGCATDPAPHGSGFLADYSQLRPGRGSESQLIYIDSGANFGSYERVLVDPVVIWNPGSSAFRGVEPEQQQWLADTLARAFRANLEPDFRVARLSQPGTLRIRMAIVAAAGSWSEGEQTFHGVVAVEVEVLDAQSGQRVAAGVDTRDGDSREIQEAFAEWASQARHRLAALRSFDRVHGEAAGR